MATTVQKTVRVTQEQWNRVEKAAKKRDVTPNHLLVELAIKALERQEWPRTEAEVQLLRSAVFTAQAIARDKIASGREDEVHQIRQHVSLIAPALPNT